MCVNRVGQTVEGDVKSVMSKVIAKILLLAYNCTHSKTIARGV
jgi:hypothetical protein